MKILKTVPYSILIPVAILLGLAPFTPQPHLVEKVGLLVEGKLVRAVDIFDLVLHGSPIALFVLKLLEARRLNP